jgi:ABC-type antimicrobial peptide transport system permease subunit
MKKAIRTFRTALIALRRNVMRAVLTTLGIIIGVAAVIAMMEIGTGSSRQIEKTIASMGAATLMVQPGTASSAGISFGSGSTLTMTPEDCDAINRECPAVRVAAPIVRARTQVIYGNKNWVPFQIQGTGPEYFDVREWSVSDGEEFTDRDVRGAARVCVIGQTLVRELFAGESPIGKEVRLNNVGFRVVGTLSSKGANMMGMDQDDVVLAPWTTIKYRVSNQSLQNSGSSASAASSSSTSGSVNTLNQVYPSGKVQLYPAQSAAQQANTPLPVRFSNVDQILAAAQTPEQIPLAIKQITDLLRERHKLRAGEPDDFSVRDMTEMTKALTSTTELMTKLLLCVALISLVVGGVGIMNIMLVSVTERTREIGLRMAVGAKGGDILRQFLVESVVLCLAGGALGIALGRGVSLLVTLLLKWPTATSLPAILAAVAVSATVGIVFGYYPAWKASRLDPIEALRYE